MKGPRALRLLFAIATVGAGIAWTVPAFAEPAPGIEVRWVAPAACPDADNVRARVRQLASDAASATANHWAADGTVVVVDGHYRLTLDVRSDGRAVGTARVIDSASCDSLAGAVAVTLAILTRGELGGHKESALPPVSSSQAAPAASPDAGRVAPAPASVPVPVAAPSVTPATSATADSSRAAPLSPAPPVANDSARTSPSAPPAPPVENPPPLPAAPPADRAPAPSAAGPPGPARWSLVLAAPLLEVDAGVLPSGAYGGGIGAGARFGALELLVAGFLWLPQDRDAGLYRGSFVRRSGELSGCYGWRTGRFAFGPCMRLTVEDVSARGTGPEVLSTPNDVAWLTIGVGGRAEWSASRWAAVFVRPTLAIATSRPSFAIQEGGPVYSVPFASVGVAIGCEWIL